MTRKGRKREGYLVVMEKKREENIWSDIAKENGRGIYLSI